MNINWNGEGLPPVGAEVEIRINLDKAPPYVLTNMVELGVNVRKRVPQFERVTVAYCSKKYLVTLDSHLYESLAPMNCVEIRPYVSAEQMAEIDRDKAIDKLVSLVPGLHRDSAKIIYDAGLLKP